MNRPLTLDSHPDPPHSTPNPKSTLQTYPSTPTTPSQPSQPPQQRPSLTLTTTPHQPHHQHQQQHPPQHPTSTPNKMVPPVLIHTNSPTIATPGSSDYRGSVSTSAPQSPVHSPRRVSAPNLGSPLSGPSASSSQLLSPRKIASNISTFKLANFILGYMSTPCPPKYEANYQLALDNSSQIITITSIDKENGGLHYTRHLSAIHDILIDPSDGKRIHISFRDSSKQHSLNGVGSILVKLYTMTLSEAKMICELLKLMMDEYEERWPTPPPRNSVVSHDSHSDGSSHPTPASTSPSILPEREIADTDIIYIGRVLKRGKMLQKWAPRWLVLKRFHLRVYKSNKLHVPSNNISLSGAKISTNEEKDKHLTLICMDRNYTFKFNDVIERDNVMSLFQKAMQLKTTPDGGLALSSIGGGAGHALSLQPPYGDLSRSTSLQYHSPNEEDEAHHQPMSATSLRTDTQALRRATAPHDWNTWSSSGTGRVAATHSISGAKQQPHYANTAAVPLKQRFSIDTSNHDPMNDSAPMSSVKRRKSRRTISRDFQSILCKPTSHALAIDETINYSSMAGFGSASSNANTIRHTPFTGSKIEFAEFEIDLKRFEKPSKNLNEGVYMFMNLLKDSIANGAHLSPTLYVPKTVWYQHHAKFQAFNIKLEVCETIRMALLNILPPKALIEIHQPHPSSSPQHHGATSFPLPTHHPSEELERLLVNFRYVIEDVQDKLAQYLSFIHTVKDPLKARHKSGSTSASASNNTGQPHPSSGGIHDSSTLHSSSAPPSSHPGVPLTLGEKLSKSMKTFGKIVSRAASATKDKVASEDSTKYVKLLHAIFDQAQVFADWFTFLETGTTTDESRIIGGSDWLNRAVLDEHLTRISEFFYCVLCNLVIRDLKSVLKRYIKHCMRTLIAH